MSIALANELFDIADKRETQRLYRFADQLRGAGMSISNNIAEGAGARSSKEFGRYLAIARKSTFENANILLHQMRGLVEKKQARSLLQWLQFLCRKISSFRRSLHP